MIGLKLISLVYILAVVNGQEYQDYPQSSRHAPLRLLNSGNSNLNTAPTPVAILKQINKHNEDGSYTYGYEGADGSFKIETKLATGEVKGKYGYVDETGKVRVVEYGANKYGFQPSGEGITVAPPTLVDETTNKDRLQADYDDEQPQQQQRYVPRPQPRPQQARPQYSAPPPPPPQRHQPQQQYNDYDDQPQQQPQQQPKYTSAPVPARAQISGAVPIDVVYSSRPRPARPDPEYVQKQTFSSGPLSQAPIRFSNPQPVQQSFAPAPQPAYSAPRPQQQQQQQQQQQPQYQQQPSGRSPSVLDQLAKDFALPQGGSPALHDISFGYY